MGLNNPLKHGLGDFKGNDIHGVQIVLGDYTMFIKHSESEGVTTLLVYINNIIITRNNEGDRLSQTISG